MSLISEKKIYGRVYLAMTEICSETITLIETLAHGRSISLPN